jgi:hypothetical protein
VLSGDADASEATLDLEKAAEELARSERGLERDDAVEEERLLADADGLRVAQGRDGDDLDAVLGRQRVDGRA